VLNFSSMSHERDDVPFYEVKHAVVDDVGNIYCAGTLPTAPPERKNAIRTVRRLHARELRRVRR